MSHGGIIGLPKGSISTLGEMLSANFDATGDQAIPINPAIAQWAIGGILISNPSASLTTAVGGFWSGPGQTGVNLVLATQTYLTLTGPGTLLRLVAGSGLTAAALATVLQVQQIFLSLTTPQGAPATADIQVVGFDMTR